jgi:hypothetical protein
MPILGSPTGPYAVGSATFVLPVRPSLVIGGAAVRTETGQTVPALRLEEVSFTAYYPVSPTITKSRWKWLNWFPRCICIGLLSLVMLNSAEIGRWRNPSEVILISQVKWLLVSCLCSVVLIFIELLGISTLLLWPLVLFFGSRLKVITSSALSFPC